MPKILTYFTIEPSPLGYPLYCGLLAIKKVFSFKTSSEAVFIAKSLKSPNAIYVYIYMHIYIYIYIYMYICIYIYIYIYIKTRNL